MFGSSVDQRDIAVARPGVISLFRTRFGTLASEEGGGGVGPVIKEAGRSISCGILRVAVLLSQINSLIFPLKFHPKRSPRFDNRTYTKLDSGVRFT